MNCNPVPSVTSGLEFEIIGSVLFVGISKPIIVSYNPYMIKITDKILLKLQWKEIQFGES